MMKLLFICLLASQAWGAVPTKETLKNRVMFRFSSGASREATAAKLRDTDQQVAAAQVKQCVLSEFSTPEHLKQVDLVVLGDLAASCDMTADQFCAHIKAIDPQATCSAPQWVMPYIIKKKNETTSYPTNDPYLSMQWGMRVAGFNEAVLGKMSGSKEIVVAVIDTGVDYLHEDLKNQMWVNPDEQCGPDAPVGDFDGNGIENDCYGANFMDVDAITGDPMDVDEHGTHCAGVIGAEQDNGIGIAGINKNLKIMALKFLGSFGGTTEGAIRAIEYAISKGANVMSNSWGGGGISEALRHSIQKASDSGILFVAAAGNEMNNNDMYASYPCSYDTPNMLCVASTNEDDTMSYFSNYGKSSVHVGAPGMDILSTVPDNKYAYMSGTSMATPMVAGMGALFMAEGKLDFSGVKKLIMDTTTTVADLAEKSISGGRVNAVQAADTLTQIAAPPSSDDPCPPEYTTTTTAAPGTPPPECGGDVYCKAMNGPGSYCKYWLDVPVCQWGDQPC